jgi:opacity protein-like surface antigen
MNNNTRNTLKGVSLVKVGVEVKPTQVLAFRAGYNYEGAIYNENGYKDSSIDAKYSDGQYYSTHNYINWKGTNRITFGMGITFDKNWALDISYQYAMQKGEYHPFESYILNNGQETVENYDTPSEVKNNRHQINATLGYRF